MSTTLKDIHEAVFRANPNYELVMLDQLSPAQQAYLSGVTDQPEVFALLCPRQSQEMMIKSVSYETAQLFNALQEPDALPPFVQEQLALEDDPNRSLAMLVLDGVLEISAETGFVSGAAAYSAIYNTISMTTIGTLATISLQALQRAQSSAQQNTAEQASYLYNYNRLPLSPYWRKRLPSANAVASFLGLVAQTPTTRKLHRSWVQPRREGDSQETGWRYWTRHTSHRRPDHEHPIYKLYISPLPAHLPEVFAEAVELFTAHSVQHFKVGKEIYGLLRPDKLIAYMDTADTLHEVTEALRTRLAGIPAHGVPFTSEAGLDGLLSWGIDPPSTEQSTAWKQRESWRMWICNRLAIAITEARLQPGALAPWQFALERIRLDGVDPSTWTPVDNLWQFPTAEQSASLSVAQ